MSQTYTDINDIDQLTSLEDIDLGSLITLADAADDNNPKTVMLDTLKNKFGLVMQTPPADDIMLERDTIALLEMESSLYIYLEPNTDWYETDMFHIIFQSPETPTEIELESPLTVIGEIPDSAGIYEISFLGNNGICKKVAENE